MLQNVYDQDLSICRSGDEITDIGRLFRGFRFRVLMVNILNFSD